MSRSLVEMAGFLIDLLASTSSWRFYLPVVMALGLAGFIGTTISNPVLSWGLAIPVVAVGLVTGWKWDQRAG